MAVPTLSWPSRIGLGVLAVFAFAVAAVSLRYLMADPPAAPPEVVANRFADPFLPIHAGFAALALAIGPVQFLPRLRRSLPWLHRAVGVTYVTACLAGGVSGLALAVGTTSGPVAAAGFGGLAIAWLLTTGRGLALALAGRFAEHRRWMIRSYALTLAAVTLRLQLPASAMMDLPFETAYPAIAFLCWVPNLVLAELWIAATGRLGQNQPASRSAG
ncbi:MAG: DUF2306 domain-containing protein [Oceanicaulis sp.]